MVTQVKRASCGLGAVYLGRHTRKAPCGLSGAAGRSVVFQHGARHAGALSAYSEYTFLSLPRGCDGAVPYLAVGATDTLGHWPILSVGRPTALCRWRGNGGALGRCALENGKGALGTYNFVARVCFGERGDAFVEPVRMEHPAGTSPTDHNLSLIHI